MNKYLLFFVLGFATTVSAQNYRFNIQNVEEVEEIRLVAPERKKLFVSKMDVLPPVKLYNPTDENLNFEAAGPKYRKIKPVVKKSFILEEKNLVIEEKIITPTVENIIIEEEKVFDVSEVQSSQTDKNISEAKELLKIAEKLANSDVAMEKTPDITEPKSIVPVEQVMVKRINPDVIISFKSDEEDISKKNQEKSLELVDRIIDNAESTLEIASYYTNSSERNIAFSRLLNARKVFLDKNVPMSQIIIMVLEDGAKKNNTIEMRIKN